MKVCLLSNVNIAPLERYLQSVFGEEIESVYVAGYDQYIQELVDPESKLSQEFFEVTFLFLEGTAFFESICLTPIAGTEDFIQLGRRKSDELMEMVKRFLNGREGLFILNTIAISPFSHLGCLDTNSPVSLSLLQMGFNSNLIQRKNRDMPSNCVLVNWHKEVERQGYETLHDPRFWYLGRIPLNETGFKRLAGLLEQARRAFLRRSKKVIALDLDNTLWGGVLGEDGVSGIKLSEDGVGKAYRDFQKMLKDTKNKGILLTIVSKNNLDDVEEVWKSHPMMVLKKDDFVAYRINWVDKAENIRDLAVELNLGLDSFVFIDDNPVERERVRQELPEVETSDFPDDPAGLVRWFSDLSSMFFNATKITAEDKKRSDFYKQDQERKILKESVGSLKAFYKSLLMKAVISLNPIHDYKRISQLTQRTNQFNLTTRRYTEGEIKEMIASPQYDVFDIILEDKFGENGIIGVIIIKYSGKEAWIDTFLMSCRVIGRTVENTFWRQVAEFLREKGIEGVYGEYLPTRKNKLVSTLYDNLGFEGLRAEESGRKIYYWNLKAGLPEYPSYIETCFRNPGEA